jgi:hypothetical protein
MRKNYSCHPVSYIHLKLIETLADDVEIVVVVPPVSQQL